MEYLINFIQNKYIYIPLLSWFGIQTFKVIYDLVTTKKFNFKRIMGAGGMPSSHSAVAMCIATMIGKAEGFDSNIFAKAKHVKHTPTSIKNIHLFIFELDFNHCIIPFISKLSFLEALVVKELNFNYFPTYSFS